MTKIVGFGCSWMYGSELIDPNDTFLSLLGENENLSDPGNTLHGMFHSFMEHQQSYQANDIKLYVFSLTDSSRQSWYNNTDHTWEHSSWIQHDKDSIFYQDQKNYVVNSECEELRKITHRTITTSIINTCKQRGFKYVMFNALPNPNTGRDDNFLWSTTSMKDALDREQLKGGKNYYHEGGHPNELGHKWIANVLQDFIDNRYPNLL